MPAVFAYHFDARSPKFQSGRPHSLLRQFRELGVKMAEIFPLLSSGAYRRKMLKLWHHSLGRQYLLDRDEKLLRGFAEQLQTRLGDTPARFLFSPSTLPLSYLETDLPVSFCADAPFSAMRNYYKSFTHLSSRQVDLSEELESRVLRRAALAVYPSRWAAESAINHYGISRERVAEIPFGANFGHANRREDVERWIDERKGARPVRLLHVGREWGRKRGDLVLATAAWLRRRGLDVEVDLVGCQPPFGRSRTPGARWHGSLNPEDSEQGATLARLFERAHFLFVPSRAEAYGMTFCEANAFGVPVVTTATGGITGIVRDGVNGVALPLEAGPEAYGAWIEENFVDTHRYVALAEFSFREFATRLNWDTHCRTFLQRVEETLGRSRPSTAAREMNSDGAYNLATTAGEITAFETSAAARPLHVAFVADPYTDPTRISSWSGTPWFARRALEKQGIRFSMVYLSDRSAFLLRWITFFWYRFVWKRRYVRDRHPWLLRAFNRQIRARLRELQPDLVFSMGTSLIAYLEADCPVAFWVDASFAGMQGFYGSFADLAKVSIRDCERSDRDAICRSQLAIYSSEWAAESARANYPVNAKSVHFVNFGANLERTPDAEEIAEIIRRRERETCRLLFVGVDWRRKGGDDAVAIAAALQAKGIDVRLTIVGCQPPAGVTLPDFVELAGFVSKGTKEGSERIARYFQESHFFVLPTRAEAYGMVFCEASAFALPSIAPQVGGIPSIIEDGVNGWLLPPEALPQDYAKLLAGKWRDRAGYEAMASACHRVYCDRLNWDAAATRVAALMRECVRDWQAAGGKGNS
jgi:glycosyltransferase involved in cell wall biosynthesis